MCLYGDWCVNCHAYSYILDNIAAIVLVCMAYNVGLVVVVKIAVLVSILVVSVSVLVSSTLVSIASGQRCCPENRIVLLTQRNNSSMFGRSNDSVNALFNVCRHLLKPWRQTTIPCQPCVYYQIADGLINIWTILPKKYCEKSLLNYFLVSDAHVCCCVCRQISGWKISCLSSWSAVWPWQ